MKPEDRMLQDAITFANRLRRDRIFWFEHEPGRWDWSLDPRGIQGLEATVILKREEEWRWPDE